MLLFVYVKIQLRRSLDSWLDNYAKLNKQYLFAFQIIKQFAYAIICGWHAFSLSLRFCLFYSFSSAFSMQLQHALSRSCHIAVLIESCMRKLKWYFFSIFYHLDFAVVWSVTCNAHEPSANIGAYSTCKRIKCVKNAVPFKAKRYECILPCCI